MEKGQYKQIMQPAEQNTRAIFRQCLSEAGDSIPVIHCLFIASTRAQESLQGLRTEASQPYFVSTFLDLPRALFSLVFLFDWLGVVVVLFWFFLMTSLL